MWCLLLDIDNGEPYQIKTNQAKKENLLAVLSLAQLIPSLFVLVLQETLNKWSMIIQAESEVVPSLV